MVDCSSNQAMHRCEPPRIARTVLGTRLGRLVLAGSVAAGLASAGAGPALAASQPSYFWVQASPATSPPGRHFSVMAYDAATGQVVLFSGEMGSRVSSPPRAADTWIWDGTTWSQAAPATSPPARQGAVMAYDAATGQLVLFGGATGTRSGLLSDTWVWDGTTWSQAAPTTSPPARYSASMAYDPATQQLVLFGGFGPAHKSHALNDTWTWNGSSWTQASPVTRPSARVLPSMAYDPAQGGIVLFGGIAPSAFLSDTWTWNGTTWTQLSPATSPPARVGASMAYDQATGQDVLFGGLDGGTGSNGAIFGDTWAWDGSTWSQVPTANSPPQRSVAVMAYDGATGQVVLFSGWNGFELPDTWNFGALANTPPVNTANDWLNRFGLMLQFLALWFVTPGILGKKKMLKAGKRLRAFADGWASVAEEVGNLAEGLILPLGILFALPLIVAGILDFHWPGLAHSVWHWTWLVYLWIGTPIVVILMVARWVVFPVMLGLSWVSRVGARNGHALLIVGAILFTIGFAVLLAATWTPI
jgi:hypothetical protein